MTFTEEQLAQFANELVTVRQKARALLLTFGGRQYVSPRAREFVFQGFLRRVKTLQFCIERVFQILPPFQTDIPEQSVTKEAEVCIQSFVFNTFGAFDNLAWTWVEETGLKRPDGRELPRSQIGLTPDKTFVRGSFSQRFQDELARRDAWFAHLEEFRHALAHRIPLYIPPYCVDPCNVGAYHALDALERDATLAEDHAELARIEERRRELSHFKPLMRHSFIERGPTVVFHAQLIADFATVHEAAMQFFDELP